MLQPFSVETCLWAENFYYSGMRFYLTVIALCAHDDQDDRDDKTQDKEDHNDVEEKRNDMITLSQKPTIYFPDKRCWAVCVFVCVCVWGGGV